MLFWFVIMENTLEATWGWMFYPNRRNRRTKQRSHWHITQRFEHLRWISKTQQRGTTSTQLPLFLFHDVHLKTEWTSNEQRVTCKHTTTESWRWPCVSFLMCRLTVGATHAHPHSVHSTEHAPFASLYALIKRDYLEESWETQEVR